MRTSEGKMMLVALLAAIGGPAWAAGQAKRGAPSPTQVASPAKAGAQSPTARRGVATKPPSTPLDPGLRRGSGEGAKASGTSAAATPTPATATTATPAGTPPQPIGKVADWFEADSYPPQARAKAQEGQTVYAVDLDAQGRILRCNVVQSSGSDLLDSTTCTQVISNGRFRPARDAAGKPVPGRYQGSMRWKLVDGPASE